MGTVRIINGGFSEARAYVGVAADLETECFS